MSAIITIFFCSENYCQKYFFQILSHKNAQIVNLKNPDLNLIRRIQPESGFYDPFFGFAPKNAKSIYGFGNPDLDFPKKTQPKIKILSHIPVVPLKTKLDSRPK